MNPKNSAAPIPAHGEPSPGSPETPADQDGPFLTDAMVEERWNVPSGYMSELRSIGKGPPHVRLGPRTVRYRPGAIRAYEQQQSFGSNAAALEAAKAESSSPAPAPTLPVAKPAIKKVAVRKSPPRSKTARVAKTGALSATASAP
jgi:hypothetical protein